MPLSDTLRAALVAQTCCGDPELCAALEQEADVIWACQDDRCSDRLRYAYTHLALIEAAQIFSRNKIDTVTRTMTHTTREDYTAEGRRTTDAESTATGRSCSWAASTSQQNFNRDSTDDTTFFSEGNGHRTAEKTESGYDRSCRHTTGHGFHLSHVEHHTLDQGGERLAPGLGRERTDSSRVSATGGGTNFLVPLFGTRWDFGITLDLNPPFIHIGGEPGPFVPINFPDGEILCPEPVTDPNDPDSDLIRECVNKIGFGSYGYGYHGKFRYGLCFPGIGCATVDWDEAFAERQYFHCSASTVQGQSATEGKNHLEARSTIEAFPGQNRSSSRETTNVYHLVRKYGTSTRRGLDTIDAEERQRGRADGQSHAETERNSKGNAHAQRRAESLTVGHNESHLRRNEALTDDEQRRAYGQISAQLARLWERIWQQVLVLERQLAAVPVGGAMNCNRHPLGCACPVRKTYLEITHGAHMSGHHH